MWVFFLIEATVKSSRLQVRHCHVFHPICVGIPRITPTCYRPIAAVLRRYIRATQNKPYSIKRHVCAQKLSASTTRKAYTIDPNWQCLSARRRGFPRTKTTANAVCRIQEVKTRSVSVVMQKYVSLSPPECATSLCTRVV